MACYIETLLEEKNISLETFLLENEGNVDLTIQILIKFIYSMPNNIINQSRTPLERLIS